MNGKTVLSNGDIVRFCQGLAVLLHAGVLLGDGLSLLAQEETDRMGKQLAAIGRQVDAGETLSRALEESGAFPSYVVGMVEVGERSGRTEQALRALAHYYEQRERQERQVRAALIYPTVLLMLMLVVIVVLLSQVLPVFDEVYASLGGQLTGIAGGLLMAGRGLNAAMPFLCVVLAAAVGLAAGFAVSDRVRDKILLLWRTRFGDKGVSRKLSDAQFAQALALGLKSGLPLEEAVGMCGTLLRDVPDAAQRCEACAARLAEGADLTGALRDSGMLPAADCRLLALGLRGGSADAVMEEISRRLRADAEQALERRVAQVEPTLVLVTSVLVGAILLSVMLPLMNIMTAVG